MRICIYGAGAIGGYMGAGLSLADADVTLIARGPHLQAMQENGLRVIAAGEESITHPACTDDPAEAGPQDYVIITLKAPSVTGVLSAMQPLLGKETCVVTTTNGIPWWYFYGLKGPWENHRLESVDPGSRQWDEIGPERVIGCVAYPACEISEPGVIRHIEGNRFTLGEPGGEKSERCMQLSKALINAGFKSPVRSEIRNEIWVKLWGNLCFNPISVLTHATLDVIATEPGTRAMAKSMMLEAQAIGEKLGVRFGVDADRRIDGAAAVGAHKTSMLQDLEAGRTMEIDALLGAVKELGQLVGVATPAIDLVLALVRQRARVAGCY
ncbi:MAG: 2-dehydropantoate 2-reductase [Gammaproteobacteria bacterium]|nr:2-dehydropantoate 2-reductase [Gammaproteobacteria bacterium]